MRGKVTENPMLSFLLTILFSVLLSLAIKRDEQKRVTFRKCMEVK